MEIEIRFEQGLANSYESIRCLALAYHEGKFLTCAYGSTWAEARANVIANAQEIESSGQPPLPEKVVI